MILTVRRYVANVLTGLLPPTRFYRLKASIWRMAGIDVDRDARLVSSVRIWTSGPVSIGADTFLGHEVMIVGGDAPVRIGAKCDIAPRVLFVTGTHHDGGDERAAGEGYSLPITVEDGVWIGAGSTLLGGVQVHFGALIGAGSLVNRDIREKFVTAGVPAKELRTRSCATEIIS